MSAYEAKPWLAHYGSKITAAFTEVPYNNVAMLASEMARKMGNKPAFTCCLPNGWSASLSFKDVDRLSDDFAAFLKYELRLEEGARIALQMPNCLAYPVAILGAFKAGLVIVNTNPLYTVSEMIHQFNDSGATALVIMDMFAGKLSEVVPKTGVRHIITASVADLFHFPFRQIVKLKLKMGKQVPPCPVRATPFLTALALGSELSRPDSPWRLKDSPYASKENLEKIACLQYTGGTTGVSKGAVLTHGNLMFHTESAVKFIGEKIRQGEETLLTALPLYHVFAFSLNFVLFYAKGGHNILVPSPRPMLNLKKVFEQFPITWMTGVNTLYNGMLNEPWFQASPPKHLRCSVAGGMALHQAVSARWNKVTGTPVIEGFGLTETSPAIVFNPINGGMVKADSIGIPMPNVDVRLVDDEGRDVPLGEPGEFVVRGPVVMKGYWQRPDDTAQVIKNGWLHTGDIAVMDADGYFKIVDRKKDMILVSGFNVYPNEVEDCIAKHKDVVEVCVIGVPDDKSGECVRAYIVSRNPDLTAQEVRDFCKQALVNYKVPRSVEFRKDLPKSNIGKILRKELRAEVLKKA